MNLLLTKLLPYIAGLLLVSVAANGLLTKMYFSKRDQLVQQVELCNSQKLEAIATAERLARESVQASFERRMLALEERALEADRARRIAETARAAAENMAGDADATARRLIREAREAENATIIQTCVVTDMPDDLAADIRMQ